jgi:putative DNA methylase
MTDDRRLIEDYLPIEAISAEASREKSVRQGHISTLHLWWARRPLVACRAAVYGALVPVARFVPNGASDEKKKSLGRANAAKFVQRLCRYPSDSKPDEKSDIDRAIRDAQRHILEAHAERLTAEAGSKITTEDILAGRAPRPKVLDMFAGGGAIPLEALRLGCEAFALDLNPVAHIIELCTLMYPQKYGIPDATARGMTGPKSAKGESTWGGLAAEVRYWGNYILKHVKAEIGDIYPLIPDPEFKGKKIAVQSDWLKENVPEDVPHGYLMPVAYIWTRTVICKNPHCRANVPLLKQTWLCKKQGRYVALKVVAPQGKKQVCFELGEAHSEKALGFDPELGSTGGNATCSFCGTVADSDHVKAEGCAGRMATQLMAVVCARPGTRGKVYFAADDVPAAAPDEQAITCRSNALCERTGLTEPNEAIESRMTGGICLPYGLTDFGKLFSPRQKYLLLSLISSLHDASAELRKQGISDQHSIALLSYLALAIDRLANYSTTLCVWRTNRTCVLPTFSKQAFQMVWDYGEMNPFAGSAGDWVESFSQVAEVIEACSDTRAAAEVIRGSAATHSYPQGYFDAIITDPPYYDNVDYAKLSDFFYSWLKRSIGTLYPEHFAAASAPKRQEAVADPVRHGGSKVKARQFYEQMIFESFRSAGHALKANGQMVVVYAHKTTLGWATLVEALRRAGLQVMEAWPIDTEMKGGMRVETASLSSSIFLIAQKRNGTGIGNYERDVRSELEQIVRERVTTLWGMGISGADLVIACVGAGLRAFTRFERVEYANGEEVPAERFLAEVETVVLETILARLSKEVEPNSGRHSLVGLDPPSRFYILWRYTYKNAELDAGEAIIFANGTHVELDGAHGLSTGGRALIEKKKGKYSLRDYGVRGDEEKLGLPTEDDRAASMIDVLHRTLWLMEHQPREVGKFLVKAGPNRDQMRLVVQALTGPALKGSELSDVSPTGELAALSKLAANWRSVVDDAVTSEREREDRRVGQRDFFGQG